jgi:hypothetical protein
VGVRSVYFGSLFLRSAYAALLFCL